MLQLASANNSVFKRHCQSVQGQAETEQFTPLQLSLQPCKRNFTLITDYNYNLLAGMKLTVIIYLSNR